MLHLSSRITLNSSNILQDIVQFATDSGSGLEPHSQVGQEELGKQDPQQRRGGPRAARGRAQEAAGGLERNLGYPALHLLMAGSARGEELIRCINR